MFRLNCDINSQVKFDSHRNRDMSWKLCHWIIITMGLRMKGLELGTLLIWSCFLLLLQPCGSMEPSCPADARRPALQTPNSTYTQLNYNSAFMSPFVNSFLGSVQSKPFPKGECTIQHEVNLIFIFLERDCYMSVMY